MRNVCVTSRILQRTLKIREHKRDGCPVVDEEYIDVVQRTLKNA